MATSGGGAAGARERGGSVAVATVLGDGGRWGRDRGRRLRAGRGGAAGEARRWRWRQQGGATACRGVG
ncbi:hypothetical protein E2562_001086 [Oryza meyeriana var. granulata]|uniref:DUF834 domain-containing protein n=1 Tax=Oryza meyeriana var. granulata TaxID=110450 RepID=A0A6G1ED75_9ORYZ|nr:hypothetical protein E2562_001086 [Oryza meyeriana var. granulata]